MKGCKIALTTTVLVAAAACGNSGQTAQNGSMNGAGSGGSAAGATAAGGSALGHSGAAGTAGNNAHAAGNSNAGGSSASGTGGTSVSVAGTAAGGAASGGTGGTVANAGTLGDGGVMPLAPCDAIADSVASYKAANPGNGGKDWDINSKTPAQIAADPAAQQLLSLCGDNQRPVIPLIAWEYGGNDHPWISPEASALVYCVYIPVDPATANWAYDAATDHVDADVYVLCPDQNPCNDQAGADQVLGCLGDPSNIEILVDTASLDDGAGAGLSLSNASTDLNLILPDQSKIHLYTGL